MFYVIRYRIITSIIIYDLWVNNKFGLIHISAYALGCSFTIYMYRIKIKFVQGHTQHVKQDKKISYKFIILCKI